MSNVHIVQAAIQHEGRIYTGRRHSEILTEMLNLGDMEESKPRISDQGFVDSDGNFHSRFQALRVAKKAGQVPEDFLGVLTSEDLW